jgi:hypothetical protein
MFHKESKEWKQSSIIHQAYIFLITAKKLCDYNILDVIFLLKMLLLFHQLVSVHKRDILFKIEAPDEFDRRRPEGSTRRVHMFDIQGIKF